MGRNKIKYNIQTRYEEMENNDYISVSSCFRQVGIRHTRLTKQRNATTKKIFFKVLWLSFVTIMFSFNPLHSQQSQDDLILSSDIPLSKEELVQIKNKITQEKIGNTPTWIYIDDKMYLIEKRVTILENQSDKESERSDKRSYKSQAKHQT